MQRQRYASNTTRQRSVSREERSPGTLYTALTIGAVVILLSVTFVADWLRTPEITITGVPQFLSPNQDNSYDSAMLNYTLSEEAQVSAAVLDANGGVIRSLLEKMSQSPGQHFLVWDGENSTGQPVVDGSYRIEISAHGSVRSKSTSVVLLVDTLPPNLQLLNLQDGTRVREELMTVEGVTESNATIWINESFQPITVDGAGRFRTQVTLFEGANRLQIRAIDPAGNTITVTRTVELVTGAPEVAITSPMEGAWINNPLVTVEGVAPAGVTLKINNQNVPVAPDGRFRFDVLLDEGDQRITITAIDDVGNIATMERMVRVKTRGPALSLNVAEGAQFSDPQILLSGSTSPGASLTVNQQPVQVGALGDFQTTLSLFEGDNAITVEARDQAGNASTLTRRVRYAMPTETEGWEKLLENANRLPSATIPAILLASLLLGMFLYRANQLSLELTVDTQRFTPGLPEEGKNLTLRLDLNHPARVTLEVLDEEGDVQATLLDNRRRTARPHTFYWDGYDDYGRPVQPGVYVVRATAGAPPIRATSAVQVDVEEDPYVYHRSAQAERLQVGVPQQNIAARRRLRQNRKRI